MAAAEPGWFPASGGVGTPGRTRWRCPPPRREGRRRTAGLSPPRGAVAGGGEAGARGGSGGRRGATGSARPRWSAERRRGALAGRPGGGGRAREGPGGPDGPRPGLLPALRRCPVITASPVSGCSQVVLFASSLRGWTHGPSQAGAAQPHRRRLPPCPPARPSRPPARPPSPAPLPSSPAPRLT